MISRKVKILFVILVAALFISSAPAMRQVTKDKLLFSPLGANCFYRIGKDLANQYDPDSFLGETAVLFLVAADELDPGAAYINEEILKYTATAQMPKYGSTASTSLRQYITPSANLAVVYNCIEYLLEQFETREYRYSLLDSIYDNYANRNDRFFSYIANKVGVFNTERGNFNGALPRFEKALEANPYNSDAFENLTSIKKRLNREVPQVDYIIHIRRLLEADPTNLSLAVGLANQLEKNRLYGISYAAYEYCIDLYSYLFPDQSLPSNLYRPWILNCYYAQNYKACIEVSKRIEKSAGFDIIARSVAVLASREMGSPQWQTELEQLSISLQNNYRKDSNSAQDDMRGNNITAQKLAWFFSFINPQPETALAYANRALSEQPDSQTVKAIMAYALTMDKQNAAAEDLVKDTYQENQIATLAMAITRLNQGNTESAIMMLKDAVESDPITFAAQKAKQLLRENGSEYLDSSPPELIIKPLAAEFSEDIIPEFVKPEDMVNIKLTTGGSSFGYTQEFDAQLIINNTSNRQIIIGPEGFFKGRIQLDAVLTGDIQSEIPALLKKVIYLSSPIKPGHHASIGLDIETGLLREILTSHPQASIDIELKIHIDPVFDSKDNIINVFPGLNTATAQIKRPALNLNRDYLMGRLDVINNGTIGQKIRAIRLFMGLIREQKINGNNPKYEYVIVPPQILKDALRRALRDPQWTVRLQCLSELLWFEDQMSPVMIEEIARGINDENWAIRLASIYLLGTRQQSFKPVLDWAVQYDSNRLVVKMASLLGGQAPQAQQPATVDEDIQLPPSRTTSSDFAPGQEPIPSDRDQQIPPVKLETSESPAAAPERTRPAQQPERPISPSPLRPARQETPERDEIDDLLNF